MAEQTAFKKLIVFLISFFSITGFIAAFTLTIEKLQLLQSPNSVLLCDINPLVSCGTVMNSQYASIFGIPWSLFGVAGYPAVLLLAIILYFQNGKMPKTVAYLATLGSFGAFVLSSVFMFISAYLIGSFCPWCVLSAISSTNIFFALLYLNIKNGNLGDSNRFIKLLKDRVKAENLVVFLVFWFLFIFVMMYAPFFLIKFRIYIFLK